jgi:uncharacterized protein YaiL (DUF2058 family)
MGLQSLRDKLLQAGLVTEEQARKSVADQASAKRPRKETAARRPPNAPSAPRVHRELTPEEKLAAEEAAAHREKERLLQKEREENRRRALEDRKRQESLRALAEKHEIAERGDQPFHFVSRKNKLLRLYLTPEQVRRLEAGELAVIEKPLPAEISYALVPREAAEAAHALDLKALRFYSRGAEESFGFKGEAATAHGEREGVAASDLDASGSVKETAPEG